MSIVWDKAHALKKLDKAAQDGRVDPAIEPVLSLLNNHPEYYTTSSCSGRIQLVLVPSLGDKKEARIVGKWHRQIIAEDLEGLLVPKTKGWLFLLAEPPILHVVAKTLASGVRLMTLARNAGFKHSGIRSIKLRQDTVQKCVIELASTERIDALLGSESVPAPSGPYLEAIVECANNAWIRGDQKLTRLEHELIEAFYSGKELQTTDP